MKNGYNKHEGRLPELYLYSQAEMCHFAVSELGFLALVLHPNGIGNKSKRRLKIQDWPIQESIRDVTVLVGFMNWYQQFIRKYAKVTTPISDMLKKAESCMTPKQLQYEWTQHAQFRFGSSKELLLINQFLTISTWQSRLLFRPMQVASPEPAF
jgi:hypothetical protein